MALAGEPDPAVLIRGGTVFDGSGQRPGLRADVLVRDGVVGFFFHPYLDADLLAEVVDGIADLGYDFVPSTSITTGWDMGSASDFVDGAPDTANSGP